VRAAAESQRGKVRRLLNSGIVSKRLAPFNGHHYDRNTDIGWPLIDAGDRQHNERALSQAPFVSSVLYVRFPQVMYSRAARSGAPPPWTPMNSPAKPSMELSSENAKAIDRRFTYVVVSRCRHQTGELMPGAYVLRAPQAV